MMHIYFSTRTHFVYPCKILCNRHTYVHSLLNLFVLRSIGTVLTFMLMYELYPLSIFLPLHALLSPNPFRSSLWTQYELTYVVNAVRRAIRHCVAISNSPWCSTKLTVLLRRVRVSHVNCNLHHSPLEFITYRGTYVVFHDITRRQFPLADYRIIQVNSALCLTRSHLTSLRQWFCLLVLSLYFFN